MVEDPEISVDGEPGAAIEELDPPVAVDTVDAGAPALVDGTGVVEVDACVWADVS